jgi:hypothetical protein
MDRATGEINLRFAAEFKFTVGSLYQAPPLLVETILTTESSSGVIHSSAGARLSGASARCAPQQAGAAAARVPPLAGPGPCRWGWLAAAGAAAAAAAPGRLGFHLALGPALLRRLVGVARVPKVGDLLLDAFLMLPTDALAIMSADLAFE